MDLLAPTMRPQWLKPVSLGQYFDAAEAVPLRNTTTFVFHLLAALLIASSIGLAQDGSTGAIRGVIRDPSHALAAGVSISARNVATNELRVTVSDSQGNYLLDFLAPGSYQLSANPRGFKLQPLSPTQIEAGQMAVMELKLIFSSDDVVSVSGEAPLVETQASAVSSSIPQQAIEGLPLNGRRFQDLALLTPGVTQDPRSLTSGSNGDLAYAGLRGWHTSFLVDGSDNNNGFFAQARGRYRAPYQFSNEVVQEFTISTNSYGAELAGAGGAVVNVVTKSGSNHPYGSGFYYLRDSAFNARPPLVAFKPADRQQQFGFTLGGPIRKDKAFFFAGFDQHIFHVPQVVEFANGGTVLTPVATNGVIPGDFEPSDQVLVLAAATQLNSQAGEFRSSLLGNAGFVRVDVQLTPRHVLNARLSSSRYYGANNVFFDPASPITNSASTSNGEEDVTTESAN